MTAWLPPPAPLPERPRWRVPPGLQRVPGYERGTVGPMRGVSHALRTASVAEPHHRRATLCGLLARPVHDWFRPIDCNACRTCAEDARARPLDRPVHTSHDLAHLRAVLERVDVERHRGVTSAALDALLDEACRTARPERVFPTVG